jgi:hypothetical protein
MNKLSEIIFKCRRLIDVTRCTSSAASGNFWIDNNISNNNRTDSAEFSIGESYACDNFNSAANDNYLDTSVLPDDMKNHLYRSYTLENPDHHVHHMSFEDAVDIYGPHFPLYSIHLTEDMLRTFTVISASLRKRVHYGDMDMPVVCTLHFTPLDVISQLLPGILGKAEAKARARYATEELEELGTGEDIEWKKWLKHIMQLTHSQSGVMDGTGNLSDEENDKYDKLHEKLTTRVQQLRTLAQNVVEQIHAKRLSEKFWTQGLTPLQTKKYQDRQRVIEREVRFRDGTIANTSVYDVSTMLDSDVFATSASSLGMSSSLTSGKHKSRMGLSSRDKDRKEWVGLILHHLESFGLYGCERSSVHMRKMKGKLHALYFVDRKI